MENCVQVSQVCALRDFFYILKTVLIIYIVTPNASHLITCSRSLSMRIFSLNRSEEPRLSIQPQLLRTLKPHTSPVVTTAIDSTGTLFATGCADGTIKVWDIRGGYVTHTFHGHGGVISALNFFELSVDSEGAEPSEKKKKKKRKNSDHEMDADNQTSTAGYRLASGSEDGKVRIWDLLKRKSIASLDSHVSVVRSLSYSPTENAVLSASRDKTIIVWDVQTWKIRRIIPVLESVEAAGFLSNGSLCYTGGENGQVAIWDTNRGGQVTKDQEPRAENEAIIAIEHSADSSFVMSVHADQTIRFHSLDPLSEYNPGSKIDPLRILRRISGNDDEIIDLGYVGPDGSFLALATNSESIRIVSILPPGEDTVENGSTSTEPRHFGTDVAHLDGHEDIIICLDVDWSGHWLATGAKDNTARLWRIDPESSSYTCCAVFTGHAESLGAISFPRSPPPSSSSSYTDPLNHPPPFLFTGSQDRTIKRWDTAKLKPLTDSSPQTPKAIYTRKAHDKDINALDVNHSSALFASASQDRTVKIWSTEDGSVVGILRGHRRGVWSVKFAPEGTPRINSETGGSNSRGLVLTGSGDKTLKIWSLSDYSCVLTFEGHTNSVLKVLWLPPPRISNPDEDAPARTEPTRPLVASAGGDGLVKVWSPYTGELETTLDNHTDRVWALVTPFSPASLSLSKQTPQKTDYSLVSGSADSTITFWTDTTSSTFTAAVNANTERIEQDQQLQNYINAGAYREAITLALQLNHPRRLLNLFTAAMDSSKQDTSQQEAESKAQSLTGNADIDTVLQSLDNENLYSLLIRVRDWNTNARTSLVAQRILYALAKSYPPSTFVQLASQRRADLDGRKGRKGAPMSGMKEVFDALAAYTDRHYRRVEELADESFLVEWVLSEMDGGVSGLSLEEPNGEIAESEKDMIMLDA